FLAQDRRLAFDQQPGALLVVGDDALAEDHPLARLELHLQCHGPPADWSRDRTADRGEIWLTNSNRAESRPSSIAKPCDRISRTAARPPGRPGRRATARWWRAADGS